MNNGLYNKVFSVQQIREKEQKLFSAGISESELMTIAAKAIYEKLKLSKVNLKSKIAIVVGGGKNGVDGIILAWLLNMDGINVTLVTITEQITSVARQSYAHYKENGGKSILYADGCLLQFDTIIECIFGIGLNRAVEGIYKEVIEHINNSSRFVVSVDIAGGLNADNGLIMGTCVKANLTIAVGGYKYGHFLNDGMDYSGELLIADIGFDADGGSTIVDNRLAKKLFSPRPRNIHKKSYGEINIIATEQNMKGALLLSALGASCYYSGAGYVRVLAPSSLAQNFPIANIPELVVTAYDDILQLGDIVENTVVCFGMGASKSNETLQILKYLSKIKLRCLVLDADALCVLADNELEFNCPTVLTPHVKEGAKLLNIKTEQVIKDPIESAQKLAKSRYIALLKGCATVITDGKQSYLDISGSNVMSKAGSGDVLSGVISAMMCIERSPLIATAVAHYVCGKAAELATKEINEFSPTPSMVVGYIPTVISDIINK